MENSLKNLKSLCLHITTTCNLNCPYCYAKGKYWRGEMSPQMIENLCDFAIEKGLDEIVWIGGEPTLYKDFKFVVRLSKFLRKKIKIVRLNTNAVNIEPLLKISPGTFSFINVSIDDLPKKTLVRNKIVWENCKTLRKAGFDLRINVTLNRLIIDYIEDLLKNIYEEFQPLEINVHNVSLAGNARKNPVELSPKEYKEVWQRIKKLSFYKIVSGPLIYKEKREVISSDLECIAVEPRRLYVIPNGDAFSCPYIVLDASKNIKSRFFWNGSSFKERKSFDEVYETGKGCPLHEQFSSYKVPKGYIALCRYIKNRESNFSTC